MARAARWSARRQHLLCARPRAQILTDRILICSDPPSRMLAAHRDRPPAPSAGRERLSRHSAFTTFRAACSNVTLVQVGHTRRLERAYANASASPRLVRYAWHRDPVTLSALLSPIHRESSQFPKRPTSLDARVLTSEHSEEASCTRIWRRGSVGDSREHARYRPDRLSYGDVADDGALTVRPDFPISCDLWRLIPGTRRQLDSAV